MINYNIIVDQEEIDVQEGRMHILHLSDTSLDQSKLEGQKSNQYKIITYCYYVGKTTAITDASSCLVTPMITLSNFFSCLKQGYDDHEGITEFI